VYGFFSARLCTGSWQRKATKQKVMLACGCTCQHRGIVQEPVATTLVAIASHPKPALALGIVNSCLDALAVFFRPAFAPEACGAKQPSKNLSWPADARKFSFIKNWKYWVSSKHITKMHFRNHFFVAFLRFF
jgi:hypothetical protein